MNIIEKKRGDISMLGKKFEQYCYEMRTTSMRSLKVERIMTEHRRKREDMTDKNNHIGLILSLAVACTFLLCTASFAATTTYTYDDLNRKVTVEQGTPGAVPTYSISGTVTSGGSALGGVTISLSGAASASTTTDLNGFYGFSGLNNGNYTVTPTKTGFTFSPTSRNVTISGSDVIAQNFTATAILPPVPPSGLTATTISSSQINLNWTDNSPDETGFKIERKPSGGTYSQIATVGANVTTYPDTGLAGNTTYYYKVRAYNDGGDSGYSNEASATTSCGTLPVRIAGATPVYYSSIQAAYNAAANGNVIQSRAGTLTENVSINRNISVTLQGGYDCAYTTNSGNVTNLKGTIQTFVGGGTLTISNFNLVQQ